MKEYPYHMHAQVISRSKSHNAVAAAAYRSGELLTESVFDSTSVAIELDVSGVNYDYRRRHGVMSSFIMAPRKSPSWATDRNKLWDKVEKTEKRKDSQLAREVIVSLPSIDIFNHLNEENKARRLREFYEHILKNYVKKNFVKDGMVADIALHEPSEKNHEDNYHAHIMLTMRRVNNDDEFSAKERDWNSPAKLDKWRREWSSLVNTTLKNHKINAFIDHRTYEERGLDIGATEAIGHHNYKKEKKGIETEAGHHNRKVKARNKAGYKYLEKLFERSPMAPEHEILAAIEKAGYEDAEKEKKKLEQDGMLIALNAKETGQKSKMFAFAPMKKRHDKVKKASELLHNRNDYALSADIVQKAVKSRGDRKVIEALDYVAKPEGFKVIETEDNGHKTTFLSSCIDMYKDAGYDVINVARNNEGKDNFKKAGVAKGVLTYRDFLRRFGERYTGARSIKQKVIIIDEADQLSPLQDKEIFETAQKINAKLIYVGSSKTRNKRTWQSQFSYYRKLTEAKRLREKFMMAQKQARRISEAFSDARILEALTLQQQSSAKYLNRYDSPANAKQGLLDAWSGDMKRRHDNRFILTAIDKDAEVFNFAIQHRRLEKKHLDPKYGKVFSVAYPSDKGSTLKRDMYVHRGEQIQFKKAYKGHGIEAGTRATVRIHYANHSLLELDDGRVIELDLRENNGFDLGYAGRLVSSSDTGLDQGYIYHNKANALDDAPLLYQNSKSPVKIFYSENMAENLEELSSQLLGRGHNLYQGFSEVAEADTLYQDGGYVLDQRADDDIIDQGNQGNEFE